MKLYIVFQLCEKTCYLGFLRTVAAFSIILEYSLFVFPLWIILIIFLKTIIHMMDSLTYEDLVLELFLSHTVGSFITLNKLLLKILVFVNTIPSLSRMRWWKHGPLNMIFRFTGDLLGCSFICSNVRINSPLFWRRDQRPLIITSWSIVIEIQEVDFSLADFWVRICGLPSRSWTRANASPIT